MLDDNNLPPIFRLVEEGFDAVILTILPIQFVSREYGASLNEIGITLKDFKKNCVIGLFIGFMMWVVISGCNLVVEKLFGEIPIHPYIELFQPTNSLTQQIVLMVSVIILAPISEEIFFRGFAYTVFKKRLGRKVAVVFSSLLFAIVHFNLWWIFQIFLIGIVLAVLFDNSKSIVATISAHLTFNLLTILIK